MGGKVVPSDLLLEVSQMVPEMRGVGGDCEQGGDGKFSHRTCCKVSQMVSEIRALVEATKRGDFVGYRV